MAFEKLRLSKVIISSFFLVSVISCNTPQHDSAKTSESEVPQAPIETSSDQVGDVHVKVLNSKIKDGEAGLIELDSVSGIESARLKAFNLEFAFFREDELLPSKKLRTVFPVPYDTKPGEYFLELTVVQAKSETSKKIKIEVVSGDYPSEKLTVPPKTVTPPKKEMKRIAREQKEIGAVYNIFTEKKYWSKFQVPADTAITSNYGSRRTYNGMHFNVHYGVDFRAKIGEPVYSAAEGEVVLAKNLYFSGNTVIINHGYGLFTLYFHLSEISVKKGDFVKLHENLGKAGMTGRASGPHLHWAAAIKKTKVNPLVLLKLLG